MNILVTALGSYGDIYPMVGLAVRLQQRGHIVRILTNPFFSELAAKYGLTLVPIGTREAYMRFANHPDLFDPRKSLGVFFNNLILPNIRSAYERIRENLQPDNTVIISSITVFGARLVQEKFQVPNITVHLSPMAFKSACEMPRNAMLSFPDWLPESVKRFYWWTADKLVVDPLIGPELNNLRKEISLPPVSRILTKWGQSPDMVIGLFPDWYGPPQIDWPQNTYLTGFPLFDEDQDKEVGVDLKSFLEAGDRPLVFMPGSLMKQAGPFFRAAVQACRELKMRGILLSRDEGQIPAGLPDTVKHLSYAPLGHILPHARALVHHGGIGTCAQALRSGVPQLIHPMAYDQFDNAWRVKRLGVGNWISQRNWQPGTVTEAIKTLTTSDVTDKQCRVVASKFADIDPLQDTCGLIESIL